jgi:8-oxo-dGTP diphosphatase
MVGYSPIKAALSHYQALPRPAAAMYRANMSIIISTLGYVLSPDGRRALLVHRNASPGDRHYGKYNGLGGKLEPNEDLASGMCREILEEADIECRRLELAGTIIWTGIWDEDTTFLGALFRIPEWHGVPPERNAEGELAWITIADMLAARLPMWAGDRYFLPLVFADQPRQFHGVMRYLHDVPVSWSYSEL